MNAFPVIEDHRTVTSGLPASLSRHLKIATLFTPEHPLVLESGRSLSRVQVAYEEYGTPARRDRKSVV